MMTNFKNLGFVLLLWESMNNAVAFVSPKVAVGLGVDQRNRNHRYTVMESTSDEDDKEFEEFSQSLTLNIPSQPNRRQILSDVFRTTASVALGVACSCCHPRSAYGLAQITTPSAEATASYDLARNGLQDAGFASGMAYGMKDYEKAAYFRKKQLFKKLFTSLDRSNPEPIIVEIGMGSFPNALYYNKMAGLDIVGVDPNDQMAKYARESAESANIASTNSLRIVHGVSEAMPLTDASADAVVCTLTLCSVLDPVKSVAEIRRVLKPGGMMLFWEHVLSETDPSFAGKQIAMTPFQVRMADGCHLDRRTGEVLREAGFTKLEMEYFELENFNFLNPTVCGIAYN